MSVETFSETTVGRRKRLHQRLDWLGAWAAFVCALHCAAVPILIGLAPFVGAHWWATHVFDQWAVTIALLFGAAVIGAAYCTHRWRVVLALYASAALLMISGAFVMHEPAIWHALLLAAGGLLLATAHVVNRRSAMRHHCTRNLWTQLLGVD